MPKSIEQYVLSQNTDFQGRVLILTLKLCHEIMNAQEKYDDRVVAKAHDVITYPEGYRERLALSVAALDTKEGRVLDDDYLMGRIWDAFDALSGVRG